MSESRQDPWGDMPSWSEGEAASAGGGKDGGSAAASANGNPTPGSGGTPDADASDDATTCPWCATPATESETRCSSCGASLAQRESIGDLVVPGLTAVDPALKDLEGRPIHLRGPSPSQGAASGIIVAAAAGGPVGLAIIGGVGALAAVEYLGAGGEKGKGHEHVGETSEAVLKAIERLDRGERLPQAADETPRPDVDSATAAGAQSPDRSATPGTGHQDTDHEERADGGS